MLFICVIRPKFLNLQIYDITRTEIYNNILRVIRDSGSCSLPLETTENNLFFKRIYKIRLFLLPMIFGDVKVYYHFSQTGITVFRMISILS